MKHLILWHKTGLLLVLFLLMITAGCTNTQKVKGNNPGILFITVDDLGWSDTQLFGTTLLYETPNVLRLAERGMKFTNAYSSSPLCSPTRAAIMSGLSPARIGLLDPAGHHEEVRLKSVLPQTTAPPWIQAIMPRNATRLDTSYTTIAEELKLAGYVTGHFGKWHLGREPYDPLHQGFDTDIPHSYGCCQPGGFFSPWKWPEGVTYDTGKQGEFIDDRMAGEVVSFIKAHKDQPFFCNWSCYSVHGGPQTTEELQLKYQKKIVSLPTDYHQQHPVTAGFIEQWDAALGKVLDVIDHLGLAEQTIIILYSDNGGWVLPSGQNKDLPMTSNAPLRSGKSSLYEGGTRVPMVVVWPKHVRSGSISHAMFTSTDFYPTLLAMIGRKPSGYTAMDGVNQVPALLGEGVPREEIFCYYPGRGNDNSGPGAWVRKGDWKLLVQFIRGDDLSDNFELYNLKDDMGESNNLAEKYPEKTKELDNLLRNLLEDTGAVLPSRNPDYQADAVNPNKK